MEPDRAGGRRTTAIVLGVVLAEALIVSMLAEAVLVWWALV